MITRAKNLWVARFILTFFSEILGVRRRNTHGLQKESHEYIRRTKDRLCLSFFITEEAMNLKNIRLQPHDPYLDQWIVALSPLLDKNNIYERFMRTN